MNAIDSIGAERQRQILVEGWTPAHDDMHREGELARAAICYIFTNDMQKLSPTVYIRMANWLWPWEIQWFKPKTRREDLVRAGALIVAEIERLDRAAFKANKRPNPRTKR